jgi:hypothetical protein
MLGFQKFMHIFVHLEEDEKKRKFIMIIINIIVKNI